MAWLTPLLYQKQLPKLQSLGVSFGKGSRVSNSDGAVPLQHCHLNGLRKLCLSKVPSGFMVAPTPLGQVECRPTNEQAKQLNGQSNPVSRGKQSLRACFSVQPLSYYLLFHIPFSQKFNEKSDLSDSKTLPQADVFTLLE